MTDPAPPAPPAGQGNEGGTPPAPFYAGFTDANTKQWVEAKGFKDTESLAQSALNQEKLLGVPKERLLKLPERMDDAAAMREVYTKLGLPETPEGYNLSMPEGSSPEFAKAATEWFHAEGLSQGQGQRLAEKFGKFAAESLAKHEAAELAESKAEFDALMAKWGGKADENTAIARAAAQEIFGLDPDKMDAFERAAGSGRFMEAMHKVGVLLGEHSLLGGNQGGNQFGKTQAAALQEINQLMTDREFGKKLYDAAHPEHASAKARWDALHLKAYPSAA